MTRQAIPITKKRQDWAERFKTDKTMQGKPLNHNDSIGIRYTRELNKLINKMIKQTERDITKLFNKKDSKEFFEESTGQDASVSSQSRILMNKLIEAYEKLFLEEADKIVEEMINSVSDISTRALNSSLKELSGGLEIKTADVTKNINEVFKASISENVNLIKTIPNNYLNKVQGEVMRSITTGTGLQNLIPFFEKQKGITKRHAKNMALDQTRKAYNSINKARMQDAGVKKFKWVHSGGGQVPRPLHITKWPNGLNGGIFSFDDLPIVDEKTGERGFPSSLPNCKCRMTPVIDFNNGERI